MGKCPIWRENLAMLSIFRNSDIITANDNYYWTLFSFQSILTACRFHHILPVSKAMSSTENTLNMSRAFAVIQNGADTSFAALENPNCPNMIAKHVQKVAARALSSGRHSTMAPKPSQSRVAAPLRSSTKSFAELCPCKKGQNNAQNKSLIEERHGNFNCSSCGAMAFRSCKIGAIDEPQSIFVRLDFWSRYFDDLHIYSRKLTEFWLTTRP